MLFRRNKPEAHYKEIPRKKWWLLPLLCLAGAVALGFAGMKIYRHVEPERLARRAQDMMKKDDFRGAALTLTRALQINVNSDAATRTMTDLVARMHMPEEIEWRRRLTELNPGSLPDALGWAQVALREGKPAIADRALATIPEEQRANAGWHSAAGMSAIRTGRWKEAREHFAEANRLDPKSDLHRYNLALAQLQSADAKERAAAFEVLNQINDGGRVNLFAQRATIAQLVRDGKTAEALEKNAALVASPGAEFTDHLMRAELLEKAGRVEAAESLAAAQAAASKEGLAASAVINWMRLRQRAAEGLEWAKTLPPEVAQHRAVLAAIGECLFALQRWPELLKTAASADWGGANIRRLALIARAQWELGDRGEANTTWARALQFAKPHRGELARLAALAEEWDWKLQMREALWIAAENPGPEWAIRTLHQSYARNGDTDGLLRVAKRQVAIDPADRRARNNVIQCSLLLGLDLPQSLDLARQLASEAPDDPVIVSTLAYALLANGQPDESLAALEKLPPAQLQQPAVALYYGLALFLTGESARAREMFALAEKSSLLPEEKALIEAARQP